MNPFMEPTVARPLPAGTRLSDLPVPAPASTDQPVPAGSTLPARRRRRRRSRTRTSKYTAVFVVSLAGLAAMLLPHTVLAVDINQASEQELQTVKGIGPKTAQQILEERNRAGKYASMVDLSERVRGIGPKKLSSLKAAGLTVGAAKGTSRSADKQAKSNP